MDIDRKQVMSSQGLSNLLLRHQFAPKQERAFMTRLLEGTLERQIYLDYVLDQFSKKKMSAQKPLIRCLLRMSLYQIFFMEQIPDSAACNEAVKIARKKGFQTLSGFINGILRNIIRKKDQIQMPDPLTYLSITCSIPRWILEKWSEDYSYETVRTMAESSLRNPGTTVRMNLSAADEAKIRESLINDGVTVSDGSYLPYILKISDYDTLSRLEAFREGWIQVQDESSAFVGQVADPDGDSLIVDVCSAPGGKSLHLADIMLQKKGNGRIISRDVSENKIELIEDNRDRCGFENINTEVFDGRMADTDMEKKADLVIADVPCSGLGILARKNDIKYNVTPERIRELVPLQREILRNAASMVKPGGILMFSTCTVTREENMENREWILKELPFVEEPFEDRITDGLPKEQAEHGWMQLLSGVHATDGFYIAKFRRKSDD